MGELFQFIFKPIWGLLIIIPMPWRFTIVILILLTVLSWFVFRGLPWLVAKLSHLFFICIEIIANILLLGEYATTQYIRNKKHRSPPKIIYVFDDILSSIVKIFYRISQNLIKLTEPILKKRWFPSKVLFILLGIIITLVWYVRPLIRTSNISKFIQNGEMWWYSLEGWVINGQWKAYAISFAPEDFIYNYFSEINNHQYQKAWNLTTVKFKNNGRLMPKGYADYLSFWRDEVDSINVIEVKRWAKDNNAAKVDVRWQYLMKNHGKLPNENIRFFLVWDAKANTWLIDNTQKL
jgi:hypothetical protein